MNHASPLFNLDDLATAEAAELVRRLQLARTSTASGYDRLRQDAEQVARKARHFSAELIRELISLGGGYELAANATLSATQADFMLGLLAASSHGELIRDALTIFVRRGPLEISDAVLYGLYDAAARLAEESRNRTMGAHYPKEIREILDAIADARMEK